jgi:hypothetical protein
MLSGSFSNQAQAFENPPLYGNILIRIRPVPHLRAYSFLLEQAYGHLEKSESSLINQPVQL